jgi:hypothetical protein
MADYKFDRGELRDRRGSKVAVLDGKYIRDRHGSRLGEIDGKYFRDNHGTRLAEFDGRDVRDSHGSRSFVDSQRKLVPSVNLPHPSVNHVPKCEGPAPSVKDLLTDS